MLKLIECPRDAMQGLIKFVPTELKIKYLNALLKVGFDTLDFGSFVSTKAVPQMSDTKEIIKKLKLYDSETALLAIVANVKGTEQAVYFDEIDYLGYPFSISEIFQQKNTNSTIEQSLLKVDEIFELCQQTNHELVIYLSMAFGNPYGEKYDEEIVAYWLEKLSVIGIENVALSDTVGLSTPQSINKLYKTISREFPFIELGVHLHSNPNQSYEKIKAAYTAGCRKFDSAIMGYGGCPMAEDTLTGNIATETLLEFFVNNNVETGINFDELEKAKQIASTIFGNY